MGRPKIKKSSEDLKKVVKKTKYKKTLYPTHKGMLEIFNFMLSENIALINLINNISLRISQTSEKTSNLKENSILLNYINTEMDIIKK